MKSLLLWVMVFALLMIAGPAHAAIAPPPPQPTVQACCVPPLNPTSISFPAYTKPTVEKDTFVTIFNGDGSDMVFASVVKYEDSCKGPGCVSGWLNFSNPPTVIHSFETDTMVVKLNYGGVITNASAPHRLWGRIVFEYNGGRHLPLPISFTIADSIAGVKFDTITTISNIRLVVGSNGNMGHNFQGKVNMNFNPPVECDTGSNSRGNADIYLGDASPIIVRKVGSDSARMSCAIYAQDYISPNGFKPLPHDQAPQHTTGVKWQQFFSGTFTTVDSLLKLEVTWYAPTDRIAAGCVIIEKLQVWPTAPGAPVDHLAIGQVYDWDVPTDSGAWNNIGGFDSRRHLIWQKGVEASDVGADCWNNGVRYAGAALIRQSAGSILLDNCANQYDSLYGGYTARNDSFLYPSGGFVPDQIWTNMQPQGLSNREGAGEVTDLHSVLVFKNAPGTGWSFPATSHDTLTVYSIMAVVRNAVSPAAGLDSLKATIDRGTCFFRTWIAGCAGDCCWYKFRGDLNENLVQDATDLAIMISYLTGNHPFVQCLYAGDLNIDGVVDSADLAMLVSYLTGGGFVLPLCHPECVGIVP